MNVQVYLTGFLSKPFPPQAACPQSKAVGQISTILSILLFLTFDTLTTLCFSCFLDAEVHFVNMTALSRGGLHFSFMIVDRKHIYIGSADMDWRSLSKVTTSISNMGAQSKISPEDKWASAVSCGWVCSSFPSSKWWQHPLVSHK